MNPLRKKPCRGMNNICLKVYCCFMHHDGSVAIKPKRERLMMENGYVRCPDEWEISAVKS